MLEMNRRVGWDEDHAMFRDCVRRFFERELVPNMERFDLEGNSDRAFWAQGGAGGPALPRRTRSLRRTRARFPL